MLTVDASTSDIQFFSYFSAIYNLNENVINNNNKSM